jgi:hypothetical protein
VLERDIVGRYYIDYCHRSCWVILRIRGRPTIFLSKNVSERACHQAMDIHTHPITTVIYRYAFSFRTREALHRASDESDTTTPIDAHRYPSIPTHRRSLSI